MLLETGPWLPSVQAAIFDDLIHWVVLVLLISENKSVKMGRIRKNSMKARFNGKCVECGDDIKTGKEILKNSKDQWVHKACCDLEDQLP